MPRNNIIITGVEKLDRKFRELDAAVGKKVVRQAIRKALKPVLAAAKANAPVKTGALKRSIKIKAVKSRMRRKGVVGLDVRADSQGSAEGDYHASFVEMGTSDTPAQPYMTPAYVEKGPQARDTLERLILEGLEHQARLLGKKD